MLLWGVINMSYQINDYYVNWYPGDTYVDTIAIATVELCGYIAAVILFEQFKTKRCIKIYITSYCVCLISATVMMFNYKYRMDSKEHKWIDLISEFTCKFGIAAAF